MPIFAVHYAYDASTATERGEALADHRAWLSGLVDAGTLLASGRYVDGSGSLMVCRGADAAEVRELQQADPFAKAGLIAGVRVQEWLTVFGVIKE